MGTLTTSKTGTLTETQSNISLSADNKLTSVQLGQIIPSESVLVFDDNARFVITFDDGTVYSTDGDTLPQSASSAEIANLDALDEIEALQALIASGEDPTAELPVLKYKSKYCSPVPLLTEPVNQGTTKLPANASVIVISALSTVAERFCWLK